MQAFTQSALLDFCCSRIQSDQLDLSAEMALRAWWNRQRKRVDPLVSRVINTLNNVPIRSILGYGHRSSY
jgi:hypothetical protein